MVQCSFVIYILNFLKYPLHLNKARGYDDNLFHKLLAFKYSIIFLSLFSSLWVQ